jgi:fructose-bisphosphate aldolase class I
MFGTKMRSVVKHASTAGIDAVVDQQFEIGLQILDHGLMPIIEPEVDIHSPTKVECEEMLKAAIHRNLDALDDGTEVMLKLSLPSIDNFYADLIDHPKVLKVVALSGGYSRDESNEILARQNGMIASFSRALAEGLSAKQTDDEFNTTLDATIASIAAASAT